MKNQSTSFKKLPTKWYAAYISLWEPMLSDNFISNGMAWFDYSNKLYRIDGLQNPWDVVATGYKLWKSEIGVRAEKQVYIKNVKIFPNKIISSLEKKTYENHHPLDQNILSQWDATFVGKTKIEEQEVDIWESQIKDKRIYLDSVSNVPVKLELKKNKQLHIKIFINSLIGDISNDIFKVNYDE